jgi:hypothetical protein
MPMSGGAVGGFYDAYVCVRDVKSSGTHGGTFTSGAWRTRNINNEQADTAGICTIASNQITLAAGTYRCIISCPCYEVRMNQARLYNVTNSVVQLLGTNEYQSASTAAMTRSFVVGQFTLAAQTTLEVQHRCTQTKATVGWGFATLWGDEVYTVAEFWREV